MELFEKFYDKTLRFLSFRPRSEKEIRDFLKKPRGRKKEKVDEPTIEKIINKLKEQDFINDEEFTQWWIEQRTQSKKPKGVRLIKLELQQKGIDREMMDMILGNYDIRILGMEGAKKLAVKQYQKYAKLPKQEAYQKLSQFLLRRGFAWDTVKKTIDEIMKKEYNTKR